ncbi:MAG TPA: metabolite traffic protein EboE [Polyangiaceae bacterium]|nr:metabolite traffic protein EboE [Polyangiaceae bacterium]
MKLPSAGTPHLTYCTNIHAGESLAEVRRNVEEYVTAVKTRVCPDQPFGVGLRLSARAAEELSAEGELASFRAMLEARDLYVFTINGFPYGEFHTGRIKEKVYLPDWLEEPRLAYTNRLASLLGRLLPDGDLEGSVSTSPGAFKPRIQGSTEELAIADRLLRHAAHLIELERSTGKTISLAIEPEPACMLETIEETVAFFERHLLSQAAGARLAALAGIAEQRAEEAIRRHLGVCFDACHMAVEFEEPEGALLRLEAAGIRIGKVQISAGLELSMMSEALRAFDDGVYLHQVVAKCDGQLARYFDLSDAFAAGPQKPAGDCLFRVHFHVPLFRETFGPFAGTQPYLRRVLAVLRDRPLSSHLEVETYTWDVLPREFRREGIVDAIAREVDWVQGQMSAR